MNYIQATIRVGILLLAGAVDVPALGQLPFAPAPLRTDLLQPPTDAGAWGGTGASLPDGSIAIGDLALNRVTLQAVDGTVLQTLVDPTAAKGQDRGFGAAVALLGTDELLVFARAGSTPASGPAVHRFRQSKPGASWQHVGVVQLAGVPATATAARNLSRLVTSPDSRQFVAVWEHVKWTGTGSYRHQSLQSLSTPSVVVEPPGFFVCYSIPSGSFNSASGGSEAPTMRGARADFGTNPAARIDRGWSAIGSQAGADPRDLLSVAIAGIWFPDIDVVANGCPLGGDFDGDGKVSGRDLGLLLGAWGPAQGSPYDLNNDGSVDGLDLGILLGNFTPGA